MTVGIAVIIDHMKFCLLALDWHFTRVILLAVVGVAADVN